MKFLAWMENLLIGLGIIKKRIENKTANIIMPFVQNNGKDTPGVLRTVLVTAPQRRHHGTGKGAEESDSNDDWAGAPPLGGKATAFGALWSRENVSEGGHN